MEGIDMTTANALVERAVELARLGTETDEAVRDLLASSGDRRVAVVMARRHLLEQANDESGTANARAMELLDQVLLRLPEM